MHNKGWDDFRALIKRFLRDPELVNDIRDRTDIGQRTLERWADGTTKVPTRKRLSRLIVALPHYRQDLVSAITKAIPGFEPPLDNTNDFFEEIPSSFWRRFFEANARSPKNIHAATIIDMIFLQLQPVLDPTEIGVQLIVAQCTPPAAPLSVVRSLREVAKAGHQDLSALRATYFLGAESLAGASVSLCKGQVVQNVQEECLLPIRKVPGEWAVAVYPIERGGDVAGCFLVSSPQPYFFPPRLQHLLQVYAYLLTDAFETNEFYAPHQIRLRPMPEENVQRGTIATFPERAMAKILRDAALSRLQAETRAWQEIEEELLTATTRAS